MKKRCLNLASKEGAELFRIGRAGRRGLPVWEGKKIGEGVDCEGHEEAALGG